MNIKSVGIIGFGDFGEFLFTLAKEYLPNITTKVFSSRQEPDETTFFSLDEVCKTDVVILCVPITAFRETIEKIHPLLGNQTIVVDVTTVKKHTVDVLKENKIPHYVATHPMFGPYSYEKEGNSLKDLRIAICDTSLDQNDINNAVEFLQNFGLKVIRMSTDDHDRLVAETLFLTHLIGQTVKKGEFERTSIDTVSFGFLMDAVESVSHDEALFRDVYTYNPYCKAVLARYDNTLKNIVSSLNKNLF